MPSFGKGNHRLVDFITKHTPITRCVNEGHLTHLCLGEQHITEEMSLGETPFSLYAPSNSGCVDSYLSSIQSMALISHKLAIRDKMNHKSMEDIHQ